MPHHPADGFNGYTITEANERGKTMPGHVESEWLSKEKQAGEDKT